ncbi:hypothetical protein DFH07DRAFT_770518 [Mycena maculata]|uniref:Uncharacterized protein n=1 Tax=Mycena maculata TaxID=230809 RepID=A0AAD7NJU3_9AGAR|nr:hypothetical protein DFH07DRAFT_770518 [Mycena maculata]
MWAMMKSERPDMRGIGGKEGNSFEGKVDTKRYRGLSNPCPPDWWGCPVNNKGRPKLEEIVEPWRPARATYDSRSGTGCGASARKSADRQKHPGQGIACHAPLALRVSPRRPELPVILALRRFIRSEAADDATVQKVAEVFQATVQSLTTSHERAQERLLASHKEAQQRLERQINALQKRLQNTNDDLKTAAVTIGNNVTTHAHVTENLRSQLEMSRNNLHLRSAIEIIAASLTERNKGLNLPNPAHGPGVQPVIDAMVAGAYNDPNVTFLDAETAVIAKLSGVKHRDVRRALATLYGELSKHHHTGVSETLTLREGEQTLPEAISAMSVILFARRLYASNFDAEYYNAAGKVQGTLSKL